MIKLDKISKILITIWFVVGTLNSHLFAQQLRMTSSHPDMDLAQKFIQARNEQNTENRLSILSNILNGSEDSKASINNFLNDMYRTGGALKVHTIYSVGNGSAIHIIGPRVKDE